MKFVADFESFMQTTVNLNQDRINRLQGRVDAIDNFIASSNFAPAYLDLIPAGSWAHRTIIKPVASNDTFDADVLLHLVEQPSWQAKDYLTQLHTTFRGSSTYKDMVGQEPKTRCVRVDYADDFHIDVVPYLERHSSNFVTNRKDPPSSGSFELSNPEAFTAWVDERQRITNGSFIKVVRLMKYLRDYKNTFSCKSIILKTLLGDGISHVEAIQDPQCYGDLPTALMTITKKMAGRLPTTMPAVLDPGGTGDNFTDRYRDEWNYSNFRECMIRYASRIEAAHAETDRAKSISLWREIFGDGFKSGVTLAKSAAESLRASEPWTGESFIDQPPFGFPMRLDVRYRLKIEGRVTGLRVGQYTRTNGFRQFTLSTHGNRVPKNRNIKFTAATNVPRPYSLYWKVRNGGPEAGEAHQLRGEIKLDGGYGTKVEPTAYAGYHYVECYVVKDDVVIASDRQDVIVT